MNILFVYPSLFNPIRGGVERVTDLLAKEFISRSHKVFYLHNKKSAELLDYKYPAPISYFPFEGYRDLRNILYYHEFLRENKIDIVINQCGNFEDSCLYLNVKYGVKTISVLHSTPYICYHYLSSDILKLRAHTTIEFMKFVGRILLFPKLKYEYLQNRKKVLNQVMSNSDRVCVLSNNYIEEFKSLLSEANQQKVGDKVVVIPNPNTFEVTCLDKILQKKKTLLYVGRLTRGEKRPDRLISIWKRLFRAYPDWDMVIVGDGPMKQSLLKQCEKLERISIVGYQNPESWYQFASIFCMTSNFEGWPMVLTEAMSFGVVPCAFKSFASVTDIIEDGKTGMLVKTFSISDYVDKLRLLMDNEDLRQSMQLQCRKKVRCFDIGSITDKWEKLFEKLRYKKG